MTLEFSLKMGFLVRRIIGNEAGHSKKKIIS